MAGVLSFGGRTEGINSGFPAPWERQQSRLLGAWCSLSWVVKHELLLWQVLLWKQGSFTFLTCSFRPLCLFGALVLVNPGCVCVSREGGWREKLFFLSLWDDNSNIVIPVMGSIPLSSPLSAGGTWLPWTRTDSSATVGKASRCRSPWLCSGLLCESCFHPLGSPPSFYNEGVLTTMLCFISKSLYFHSGEPMPEWQVMCAQCQSVEAPWISFLSPQLNLPKLFGSALSPIWAVKASPRDGAGLDEWKIVL